MSKTKLLALILLVTAVAVIGAFLFMKESEEESNEENSSSTEKTENTIKCCVGSTCVDCPASQITHCYIPGLGYISCFNQLP